MAPLQQLRRKASHCGEPRRGAGAARNPARSDTIPFLSADTQPRRHPPSPIRGRGRVGDIKAPFFLGKRLAAPSWVRAAAGGSAAIKPMGRSGSLPPSPAARPHREAPCSKAPLQKHGRARCLPCCCTNLSPGGCPAGDKVCPWGRAVSEVSPLLPSSRGRAQLRPSTAPTPGCPRTARHGRGGAAAPGDGGVPVRCGPQGAKIGLWLAAARDPGAGTFLLCCCSQHHPFLALPSCT